MCVHMCVCVGVYVCVCVYVCIHDVYVLFNILHVPALCGKVLIYPVLTSWERTRLYPFLLCNESLIIMLSHMCMQFLEALC